jgi:hypothetical protein
MDDKFLQSLVRQTGEKSTGEAIRVLLVLAVFGPVQGKP